MSEHSVSHTATNTAGHERKLLDVMRERLRTKHYSLRTEQAYFHWAKRYILFHGKRHPRAMGAAAVEAFLSHLANAGRVSPSTHQQALSALLFLYKEVLAVELLWLDNLTRPKPPSRLPTVLTQTEVGRLLLHLNGIHFLMARMR